jgi:sugar (pentulose or hexulose) kinase
MNSSDEIILAIDFGTQRSTLINIDKNGNSLRPAISWLDQRQTAPGKYPGKLMQLALRVAGMREAVKSMTRPGEQYLPDGNNVHNYNQLYEKVYSKMYKRLQPLYDPIRSITGYPQKI